MTWVSGPDKYVRVLYYNTYMSKLTLSVDEAVIERAKGFARRRETSISALVEGYLEALTRPVARGTPPGDPRRSGLPPTPPAPPIPPITARLAGILRGQVADRATHRRHLDEKYR